MKHFNYLYRMGNKCNCSKCGSILEQNRIGKQRYCKSCHAEFMRLNRPKHSELKEESRLKANARSYLNVYLKRGSIVKEPCAICGDSHAEAHHEDYSKPLEVIWLCREHHLSHHRHVEHHSLLILQ